MDEKKKILFVDDDVNSLDSLRRMLSRMRREWHVEFAEGGEAALKLMETEPFDVIVADMRMPVMDGAQLLTQVKERYPGMVRIILSGHSNPDLIMNSIGPCHQFLAKPCSSEKLKDTINRACALRSLLNDEKIQTNLAKLDGIPSIPSLYAELQIELKKQDASIKTVSKIIAKDPGMSAKILQLVNSAFFGLPRHISSVEQAVSLLGLEIINALVLSTQVFHMFDIEKIKEFSIEKLANHNLAVGACAKRIAEFEKTDKKIAEQAFMAGLLHDVGKLVLAATDSESYQSVLNYAQAQEIELWQAEVYSLNNSHAEVGAYLLGLWGLPDTIVEAIAYHQNPSSCLSTEFGSLAAVHAANVIYYQTNKGHAIGKAAEFDMAYLESVGCREKIDSWKEVCEELNGEEE